MHLERSVCVIQWSHDGSGLLLRFDKPKHICMGVGLKVRHLILPEGVRTSGHITAPDNNYRLSDVTENQNIGFCGF